MSSVYGLKDYDASYALDKSPNNIKKRLFLGSGTSKREKKS